MAKNLNNTSKNQKKVVKYTLRFLIMAGAAAIIIVCVIIWFLGKTVLYQTDKRLDCNCGRCTECEDYGDNNWIIVKATFELPDDYKRPNNAQKLISIRAAQMHVARHLVWCVQAMRLPDGQCVFNYIYNRPDEKEKLSHFLDDKYAMIKNKKIYNVNEMLTLKDLGNGIIELTVKVSKKEILQLLNVGG